MSPARLLPTQAALGCAALLLLTSCATRSPSPAPVSGESKAEASAPPAAVAESAVADVTHRSTPTRDQADSPTRPLVDPVAVPVVERLATQLLMPPEAIVVAGIEPHEWPDGCLGLPAEGEICSMALTPGYLVKVTAGMDTYEFRTDLNGERVRVASAPPARTGDPLVTWSDSRSFNVMIVGTQRVAIGRRGRPLIASPLSVPARASELQGFLARFAPFQAQTPAGEIALRGVGALKASPTEQRMIAEWARLVSLEARAGGEQPEGEVALRWSTQGGLAGMCDAIEVSRVGRAVAHSCRGGQDVVVASLTLEADAVDPLYRWLDHLEAFEIVRGGGSHPDAMTTRLNFLGTGVDEAVAADHEAILAWIDSLAARLRAEALKR